MKRDNIKRKKMWRNIRINIFLTFCTVFMCGAAWWVMKERKFQATTPADATLFLNGIIDGMYRNRYAVEYEDLLGLSSKELREYYVEQVAVETEYFCTLLNLEEMTEIQADVAEKYIMKLYQMIQFRVISSEKLENGNFELLVELRPLESLSFLSQEYLQEITEIAEKTGENSPKTQYAQLILEDAVAHLQPMTYGAPQEMTIRLERKNDAYYVNQDDWYHFQDKVIDYFGNYAE